MSGKRVLVAMSGGVDSSVAAALLAKQGYLVMGAYMKNFSAESWEGVLASECPWEQDVADAQAVCEKLGIEFRSFNFEKEYNDRVIEYFFAEYAAGRTPNPDIMCNKEIKFKLFLDKALELGFDYIATGHYARIQRSDFRSQSSEVGSQKSDIRPLTSELRVPESGYKLLKGIDPNKDQSYFLYTLNQDQLSRSLFPIGEYTKPQIRELARDFGLPNAEKKDSQGICFVGHVNLREFLRQRIPDKAGEIVDPAGRVIGQHPGVWHYTIGQRQGLGIGGAGPYYVATKDISKNQLTVVSGVYDRLVYHTQAILDHVHWISGKTPEFPFASQAKIRYQQEDQECVIKKNDQGFFITFREPQFAIASGQSIVFYQGDQVLGGGVVV